MRKKKATPFKTEADLCAAFTAAVGDRWTSYNETASYDILLVRNTDGFQIGIQAKLKLTPFVLAQALDESRYAATSPGPDCRGVLVPWGEIPVGLGHLCAYIGITIVRMSFPTEGRHPRNRFEPSLPDGNDWVDRYWYEQAPTARCKLPEYVPDVAAGKPSPVQLTEWKIMALKIMAILDANGFVTRADFRHVGIDHRRWIAPGAEWLRVENGHFFAGARIPDFKAQHPVVFEKIKSDAAKWMPQAKEAAGPLL